MIPSSPYRIDDTLRVTTVGSEACLGFSPHSTHVRDRVMSVLDSTVDMQNPSHLRFMQDAGQHSLQVCSKSRPHCSVSYELQSLKNKIVRQNSSSYDEPISALNRSSKLHSISSTWGFLSDICQVPTPATMIVAYLSWRKAWGYRSLEASPLRCISRPKFWRTLFPSVGLTWSRTWVLCGENPKQASLPTVVTLKVSSIL